MAKAATSARSRSIAALHAGKRALGWDDETYRDFLSFLGKTSASELTDREIGMALDRMRELGFKRADGSTAPAKPATSDNPAAAQLTKIQELWSSLAATGALNDPSESALRSFGRRVTGAAAPEFMTVAQRIKLIEALKAWVRREPPAAVRPSTAPRSIE